MNIKTINNKCWLSPAEYKGEYGFSKSTQSKMRMASNSSALSFSRVDTHLHEIDHWLENHQIQGASR